MNHASAIVERAKDSPSEAKSDRHMSPREIDRLARAFEHSAAGIALQSPEGRWIDVNPAFCALVGMERGQLVGRSFSDITHPDDLERSLMQLNRLNRGEIDAFRFDKRYLHADGREVWVRLDVSTIRDDAGQPELIITQANDITTSRQIRAQLAANEARLHSIIRSIGEGMIVLDLDGQFTLVNGRAAEILGVPADELPALGLDELAKRSRRSDGKPFEPGAFPAAITLATAQPQREVTVGFRRPDGERVWIEINTEPVRSEGGDGIAAVVATFSDITRRLHTERALQESEERFSLAVEGARVGMWDWRLDANRFKFNPIAARMLGYREDEVASRLSSVRALVHPDDEQRLVETMEAHLSGRLGFFDADLRLRRKSGGYIWANMRGRVTARDAGDRPLRVTGTVLDIGDRKRLEARLTQLATTDDLTGLLNRRAGSQKLADEIGRAARSRTPLTMMLLDIDHFKSVNDRFGHDAGDEVLRQMGELLRIGRRSSDAAARWGGEEFALILPETSLDGAAGLAANLLESMGRLRLPDGAAISGSFGVVSWRSDESASDLVKRADRLMYRAKNDGRARVEVERADS
jgi:diguanylate cyclase (GGDEF)-like protein/PAS domain S-box-containing protein